VSHSDDWAFSDLRTISLALARAIETADISIQETEALETLQKVIDTTARQLEEVADAQ